jgi:hypothetical protein
MSNASLLGSTASTSSGGSVDTYMYTDIASDIGGYYQAVSLPSYTVGAIGDIPTVVTTSPTLMGAFATNIGFPNITVIPAGLVSYHVDTEKVAGSNNYYIYAELYKRSSGGTETLLATSDVSTQYASNNLINQTVTGFISTNTFLLSTDRLVTKWYGVMLSASATIHLYFDDATSARTTFPAPTVDATNFVPYTGATLDIDLGTKNISVADEVYGAGWNGSLEAPTKNAVYDKIETISGGGVTSVNSQTGVVVLDADDIDDAATTQKFVTSSDLTKLSNLSGTNTGDQSLFQTIAVSGQSNVVADTTTDTLTIVAGTGISITTDAAADSVTITNTASGAFTVTETEIDFGTTPVSEASFTVTVVGMTTAHKILTSVSYATPTGKDQDELEMDDLQLRAVAGTGDFALYVRAADGSYLADKFKINYSYA